MKICLVRPATVTTVEAVGEDAAPPIGLAYLASSLKACGHDVTIVDGLGEALGKYAKVGHLKSGLRHGLSDEEIIARIPEGCDVIGVSIMFSLEWPFTRDLTQKIRNTFPNSVIVAGGEHISALPEFSLEDCKAIDYCVLGEGEPTLIDLVETIAQGANVDEVGGLCIRKGERFERTQSRKRIRQLDTIPPPAWELVPIEAYLSKGIMTGVDYGRSMPILASRGCPYRCSFCSNPVMWGPLWRARSPVEVVNEIEGYVSRYRATNFDFYDLTAIVKRSWIVEFCNLVIERKLNITWQLPSGTRSEAIDEEVCRLLYESGCRYINYAPESGSEVTLKAIKKQIDKAAMMDSIKGALSKGLNVKSNFIIGFPGETLSQVFRTYKWIAQMAWAGVHDVSAFPFSPYPGSELFINIHRSGAITLDDAYFYSLSQYTDPSHMKSYCENIPKTLLRLLCLGAMGMFYAISYSRRPSRFAEIVKYVRTGEAKTKLAAALIRVKKKRNELMIAD